MAAFRKGLVVMSDIEKTYIDSVEDMSGISQDKPRPSERIFDLENELMRKTIVACSITDWELNLGFNDGSGLHVSSHIDGSNRYGLLSNGPTSDVLVYIEKDELERLHEVEFMYNELCKQ